MRFFATKLAIFWVFNASANPERPDKSDYTFDSKDPQLFCLAQNIFFEAGTESYMGKVAVALVTLNRVKDSRYPNNVCDVIKQGPTTESWKTRQTDDPSDAEFYPVRNKCQFSWYCDGKDDAIPRNARIGWKQAQEVALYTLVLNQYKGLVEGATHYHADYVAPTWRHKLTLIGKIDRHIFYRWD